MSGRAGHVQGAGEDLEGSYLGEKVHEIGGPGDLFTERWRHPWLKNWTRYEADARAIIAAHEALTRD